MNFIDHLLTWLDQIIFPALAAWAINELRKWLQWDIQGGDDDTGKNG